MLKISRFTFPFGVGRNAAIAVFAAGQFFIQSAHALPFCPPDSDAPVCTHRTGEVTLSLGGGTTGQGIALSLPVQEVKTGNAQFTSLGLSVMTTAPAASVSAPTKVSGAREYVVFKPTESTPPGVYTVTAKAGDLSASAVVRVKLGIPLNLGGTKDGSGQWPAGTESTPIELSQCSSLPFDVTLSAEAGVTGPVTLSATGLPAGVTATFTPASVTIPAAGGVFAVTMNLTGSSMAATGKYPFKIVATTPAGTGSENLVVNLDQGVIDSVTPGILNTPQSFQPGSTVVLTGQGFCPDSTVRFGNANADVKPASIDPKGTSLTAVVPLLATGGTDTPADGLGRISVISATSTIQSAPIAIDSWRNIGGFAFINSTAFQAMVGGYSAGDLGDVFGSGQLALDWFLDPFVTSILIPLAENIYSSQGQCFGFAMSAINFQQNPGLMAAYPAWDGTHFDGTVGGAARDAWHLRSPLTNACQNAFSAACTDNSPALAHYIHLQHVRQFSNQMADVLSSQDGFSNTSDFKQLAHNALAQGGALVILRAGTKGHVVVLINARDDGSGGVILDTADPNVPFGTAEDATDGATHSTAISNSQVKVKSGGDWTYNDTKGVNMSSNKFDLFITPAKTFANVDFPTALTAVTSFGHLIFGSDGAQVTQITDAAGHTMLTAKGDVNVDTNSRIPKSGIWPAFGGLSGTAKPPVYLLPADGAYTYQMRATGAYTVRAVHAGFSAMANVGAGTGGRDGDQVLLDTKGALEVRTASPKRTLQGTLTVRNPDRTQRAVKITSVVTNRGGARLAFSDDHEQVIYTHNGAPGTVNLEFYSSNQKSARLTAAPMQLQRGDVVTYKPDWTGLDKGAGTINLRKAGGVESTRAIR